MEYKKKPQSSVPVLQRLPQLVQAAHPAPAMQRQALIQRDLQRHTTRPTTVQRQVAGPALKAAQLHTAEVQRLSAEQTSIQRQAAEINLPQSTVDAALQRQQAVPAPVPTKPQSIGDWVTVMRFQAEQSEGRRMGAKEAAQFTALQRQVAQTMSRSYLTDRQSAVQRQQDYAGHVVALQRHHVSGQVARAFMLSVPQGERAALQRAVDEVSQQESLQRQQDEQALKLHTLQRQLAELDQQATQPVFERIQQRRGAGNPLPEAIQRHLEQGLNHDLSAVRIHDDAEADKLAKGVNAIAFTTGTDIYFQSGKFNPNSQSGLELLAHEVTHTVQQSKGQVGKGIDPDSGLESEARAMGRKLSLRKPLRVRKLRSGFSASILGTGISLQRASSSTKSKLLTPEEYVADFKNKISRAALTVLSQNEKRLRERQKSLSNTQPSNPAWQTFHDAARVNAFIVATRESVAATLSKKLVSIIKADVPYSLGNIPIRFSDNKESLLQAAYISWSRSNPAPASRTANTKAGTQAYLAEFNKVVAPLNPLFDKVRVLEDARDYLGSQYPEIAALSRKSGAANIANTHNTIADNVKLNQALKGEYDKVYRAIAKVRDMLSKGKLPWEQMDILVAQVAQQEGVKPDATDPKSVAISQWLKQQKQDRQWLDIGLAIASIGMSIMMLFMPEFILPAVGALATGGMLTFENFTDSRKQNAVSGAQGLGGKQLSQISPEAAKLNMVLAQVDVLLTMGGLAGSAGLGLSKAARSSLTTGQARTAARQNGNYGWQTGSVHIGNVVDDVADASKDMRLREFARHEWYSGDDFYRLLRLRQDDVPRIAKLIGMSQEIVLEAKQHLMMRYQLIKIDNAKKNGVYISRFEPNPEDALVWHRVSSGVKIQESELAYIKQLIIHEYEESKYLKLHPSLMEIFLKKKDLSDELIEKLKDLGILEKKPILEKQIKANRPITPYVYSHTIVDLTAGKQPNNWDIVTYYEKIGLLKDLNLTLKGQKELEGL